MASQSHLASCPSHDDIAIRQYFFNKCSWNVSLLHPVCKVFGVYPEAVFEGIHVNRRFHQQLCETRFGGNVVRHCDIGVVAYLDEGIPNRNVKIRIVENVGQNGADSQYFWRGVLHYILVPRFV